MLRNRQYLQASRSCVSAGETAAFPASASPASSASFLRVCRRSRPNASSESIRLRLRSVTSPGRARPPLVLGSTGSTWSMISGSAHICPMTSGSSRMKPVRRSFFRWRAASFSSMRPPARRIGASESFW